MVDRCQHSAEGTGTWERGVEASFDEGLAVLEFSKNNEVAAFESAEETISYIAEMEKRLAAYVNTP